MKGLLHCYHLQCVVMGHSGIQGVVRGHSGIQGVVRGHSGILLVIHKWGFKVHWMVHVQMIVESYVFMHRMIVIQ